ncbi:CD221 [Mytilus edulis]|uniref:IGF1R n=1 Tax=Mytilus edulis TaxID=6550 RepID=A0A8S3PYN6_MYTED|nr:CD221 [Mytilus edulis]
MGLCISLQANCEKCNFDTRACKVYTECEKKSRGPAAGYLHEAMTLAILKTKMGGTDLQMALACLNIKVPSLQLISTNVNKQCDKMIELNEAAMVKNQQFVQEFNQCIGKDNEVDVETDTAYNNRNQVGYEAGTQSFCPLIEKNTGLNLLMTMSTANKLCNKKNECCHTECKKTYSSEETISSSEGKLAEKNLQKMNDLKILKVKSVTSDASAQLSKVVREFGKSPATPYGTINVLYIECALFKSI